MANMLIAGHSHSYCLGLPSASADAKPEVVPIAEGFDGLIGPWPRTEVYWDELVRFAKAERREVGLSFLGNEHHAHFLIERAPFDFVLSSDPSEQIESGVPVVPETLVRGVFKNHRDELPRILKKLSDGEVNVLVIGTPPPKKNIADLLTTEPFFIKKLESVGLNADSAKLSPASLQLKLWRVIQDLLEEASMTSGATFFPYPTALISDDGFLRPEYSRNDVTHANAAAGEKILQLLRNRTEIVA